MMLRIDPSNVACRACGNERANLRYTMRERMFGLGHEFDYVRCASCGTRSIVEVPADLSAYYPGPQYYSLTRRARSPSTALARRWRNRAYFAGPLSPMRLVLTAIPDPVGSVPALSRVRRDRNSRILDIGSGVGELVDDLAALGFRSLTAVDPFLPEGAEREEPPVEVRRAELRDLHGHMYDVAMFQHSIEHLRDPVRTLVDLLACLAADGVCLIRTPLADSWAAEQYGVWWVGHDAPRHLVVFTEAGLRIAAARAGFVITQQWRDSTPFQIWASEAYRRGERLIDVSRSRRPDAIERFLSLEGWRQWRKAQRLNQAGRGDQGVFVLQPAASGAARSGRCSRA